MTNDPAGPVTGGPGVTAPGATTGRRAFALALLLCVAGAGLVLYAVSRVWLVEVAERAAPLPPLRTGRTGSDLLVWVRPLAVVSLAGAGALIATRALVRRAVGGLLAALGVAIAVGAATELGAGVWPVLTLLGAAAVAVAGAWTAARGADWPSLGARYERPAAAADEPAPAVNGPRGTRQAWDALDRGEDPTD